MAPEQILRQVLDFKFREARLWQDGDFILLAFGSSTFIRFADRNNERIGVPFPALTTKDNPDSFSVGIQLSGTHSILSNLKINGFHRALMVDSPSSFTAYNLSLLDVSGYSYNVDFIMGERFSGEVDRFKFKETCELMLARIFSDAVVVESHAA